MKILNGFFLIFIFVQTSLFASPIQDKPSLVLYGGIVVNSDLLPILIQQKLDYGNSYIGVGGLSLPLSHKLFFINFEAEGHIAKHTGEMNHWELNGMYMARIPNLFGLPISIAIGEGLSYATENPKMENQKKGLTKNGWNFDRIESRQLLNYLAIELEYKLEDLPRVPRLFVRIHHRSGVFGLFCGPDPACGSNYFTYGIKFQL